MHLDPRQMCNVIHYYLKLKSLHYMTNKYIYDFVYLQSYLPTARVTSLCKKLADMLDKIYKILVYVMCNFLLLTAHLRQHP